MATRRPRKQKADEPETLEARLGVRFKRPELLALALTHSSFTHEAREPGEKADPGADNEQMEFLGDAVLGLIVSETLYTEFPHCDEGELTRLRSSLVSRPHLTDVGNALGVSERLRVGRSAELTGVTSKRSVIADTVEALIAAVYLDSGMTAARRFVERFIIAPQREALQQAMAAEDHRGALRDAKSVLQERVQASGLGRLRYVDTGRSGPAHQLHFAVDACLVQKLDDGETVTVLSSAEGHSKKEAQQLAAQRALDSWATAPPAGSTA